MGRKVNNRFYLLILFTLFFCKSVLSFAQETRTIIIDNADITEFDNTQGNQRSRLIGNVKFRHEDVFMSCDSAHFYPDLNLLDAFSQVHIWRGDTLDLYGDFLK